MTVDPNELKWTDDVASISSATLAAASHRASLSKADEVAVNSAVAKLSALFAMEGETTLGNSTFSKWSEVRHKLVGLSSQLTSSSASQSSSTPEVSGHDIAKMLLSSLTSTKSQEELPQPMASVPSEDFVKFCNANAMMKKPLKLLPIAHSMLSVVHAECREQCFLDLKGIDLLLRIVDAHIPEQYIKDASACMEGLAVSGTHEYVDLVLPPAMEQQEKVNIVERMFKMRAELAVLAATELVDIEELQNVPGLAYMKTLMDKIVPADVSLPTPNRHALWKEMLACTSAPNV